MFIEVIDMNQDAKTREFYNKYGEREWERLEKSAYDRLNFLIHLDFIKDSLISGIECIDVGCGAGRFSIELTKAQCNVTLFDISDKQLSLAKDMINKFGEGSRVKDILLGSIADMNDLQDNQFDVTVCYGAPLNYLFDDYKKGIQELYRITKPGGRIFVSVNSRLGVIRGLMGRNNFDIVGFMGKPEYWYIKEVVESGDLPEHPEVEHPARHFFISSELQSLFEAVGFEEIELGSSPSILSGLNSRAEELYMNDIAWKTTVELELKTYRMDGLADSGEFLLLRGRKPKYPTMTTKSFTIRLIRASDSKSLFRCYNDKKAVEYMNDDNCDFGFFVDSEEKMRETIGYWIDFYQKQYFVRFSIVDNATEEAVGTIEGFSGETGVLRVDICSEYEKACYLSELFNFAKDNFKAFFGNEYLVTKAISKASERREALVNNGWEFIDTHRDHHDYYRKRSIT